MTILLAALLQAGEFDMARLRPFWTSTTMEGESVLFMKDGDVARAHPQAEFILVATMLANPDWTALRHERFPEYRDALASLRGPGVELADLSSVWAELHRHKRDADLTGNGVNHPNDFGHRIYAQVLGSLLVRPGR